MNKRTIWILFWIWLAVYAGSFVSCAVTEPTGDSFLRGVNRLGVFFGWQVLATLLAFAVWFCASQFPKGSGARWLMRLPGALAAALFALIVGVVLFARYGHPPPEPAEPPPVTRPVTPG